MFENSPYKSESFNTGFRLQNKLCEFATHIYTFKRLFCTEKLYMKTDQTQIWLKYVIYLFEGQTVYFFVIWKIPPSRVNLL